MAVPDNIIRALPSDYKSKGGSCRTCNKGLKLGVPCNYIHYVCKDGTLGSKLTVTCGKDECRDAQLKYWFERCARGRSRSVMYEQGQKDGIIKPRDPRIFLSALYMEMCKLAYPDNFRFDAPPRPIDNYYADGAMLIKGVLCNEFNWDVAFTADRVIRATNIDTKKVYVGTPVGRMFFLTDTGKYIPVK